MWIPVHTDLISNIVARLREGVRHTAGSADILDEFKDEPDLATYLVHIACPLPENHEVAVRLATGYQLKSNVDLVYHSTSPAGIQYIQKTILVIVAEPVMRPVATQIITALLQESGPLAWRDWMRRLVSMLDNSNPELQEATLMVLFALYVSNPNSLDATVDDQWTPQLLMHKYAVLTGHSSLNVRALALACLSTRIPVGISLILETVPNIFRILSCVAVDCSPDVRRNTCQVLMKLFTHFPRDLMPGSVGEVMVQSLKDDDEGVALAACNFWYMLVKLPRYTAYTRPFLLSIIHALLDRMTYRESTSDTSVIGVQSPLFVSEHGPTTIRQETGRTIDGLLWDIRVCSTVTLGRMAVTYGNEVSDMLLVPLKTKMYQHNWLVRESAILAWGIVSTGCMSTIAPHLQAITPYLLQACGDPQPLIRSTSCWTLGRYAQAFAQTNENRLFLAPIINRCLVLFFNTDERVQQGACSTFTRFCINARESTIVPLDLVVRVMSYSLQHYNRQSLRAAYCTLYHFAQSSGTLLSEETYVDQLVPVLMRRWAAYITFEPEDPEFIELVKVITMVIGAIGPLFLPYMGDALRLCFDMIGVNVVPTGGENGRPLYVLHSVLDVLFSIVWNVWPMSQRAMLDADELVMPGLVTCLNHPDQTFQRSSYALLGDLVVVAPSVVHPYLSDIMSSLMIHFELGSVEDVLRAQSSLRGHVQ
ncbi:uncharacterized protein ARMOST_04517 [Armillaria ostoyae]|uniref:Importin N-terminal domain-containing protein n=1 Tax=Armillaria ostoyae TaxID=47428 RepID=A0A284QXJ3_ARMOS|nr:uncharacterized protein ARMOST_04517 [Armillaria ostoyae]